MSADRALIEAVREDLAAAADPVRARQMQAYMKSAMPFHGVPAPAQRRIFTAAFAAHRLDSFEDWRDTLLALWREATHREERYAALDLARRRTYAKYVTLAALPVFEEFIVTGAWWDLVDETSRMIGALLRADPAVMSQTMRAWSGDEVLWKRRMSIICQLGAKADTDLDLLYACIEANLGNRDFFIRKAIGYVRAHADRLSPLSKREALRHVLKSGAIDAIP
jgi:3-methyladenine DNA glycosylase AlkD